MTRPANLKRSRSLRVDGRTEREARKARCGVTPAGFGVYRPMAEGHYEAVAETVYQALSQAGFADILAVKQERFVATLLPRRMIDRELWESDDPHARRSSLQAAIERRSDCQTRNDVLRGVTMDRVKIAGGRVLYVTLGSPHMVQEHNGVDAALSYAGVTNVLRGSVLPRPNVVLGETIHHTYLDSAAGRPLCEAVQTALLPMLADFGGWTPNESEIIPFSNSTN